MEHAMSPAQTARSNRDATQLLVVDPEHRTTHAGLVTELPRFLRAGDLLVLNDAATLPASLPARSERGDPLEVRLLGPARGSVFSAVLFGAGDYRTRTELRPAPPALQVGAWLSIDGDDAGRSSLRAHVEALSPLSSRLVELRFDREGQALWIELYARGRPVQYAHQTEPLALWSVQTLYAARPWAAEMPSAGRPLSFGTLLQLKRRGVELATLTHAAGLSATGDPALDKLLPLPERYEIPAATVESVRRVRASAGRVIAVGTSVVRALEAAAIGGTLQAGEASTDLRIDARFKPQIVAGLLTGVHSPEESHYALLSAFAPPAILRASHAEAERLGYLSHEFGDTCLILSGALPAAAAA
jgi:S-adenosylmethionine:tRNA ribosyltransferase-isomerase